ncbi:MAG: ATP-binding protein [Eubacteriaceae bacterium]|nr:ATP-binding protein [Eubacteriaceae bacterium]
MKIITGHFGSGKTEFSLNYAMILAKTEATYLVDMDIINPYFRSRELYGPLERAGVKLIADSFGQAQYSIDLPALPSSIYGLVSKTKENIVFDVGGDPSGARVLGRYANLIKERDSYDMYMVVNANRPLTMEAGQVVRLIGQIEETSCLKINGLVNNTHMLRETTVEDMLKGRELCVEVGHALSIPLVFNVCLRSLNLGINRPILEKLPILEDLFEIDLMLRPDWL